MSDKKTAVKEAEERRVEFNFPILILRTKRFEGVFNRLGALPSLQQSFGVVMESSSW